MTTHPDGRRAPANHTRRPTLPTAGGRRDLGGGGLDDLVAYPAVQLGFLPWGSVCLVGLGEAPGAQVTLGPVARMDGDPLLACTPSEAASWSAGLADQLADLGYRRLALVLHAPQRDGTDFAAQRDGRWVRGLVERVASGCLAVHTVLVVTPAGWGHARCPRPGCCPETGRPVEALRSSRMFARFVLDGGALVGGREDLRVRECERAGCRDAVAGALATARRAPAVDHVTRSCDAWTREVRARATTPEGGAAERPTHPAAGTLAQLAAGIEDVVVRDAVLAWALADESADDRDGVLALVDPAAVTDVLRTAARPGARTAACARVLEDVIAHVGGSAKVQALATLGYLRWWQGQGARADVAVEQALQTDPNHSLATLVRQIVLGRVPPAWVTAER